VADSLVRRSPTPASTTRPRSGGDGDVDSFSQLFDAAGVSGGRVRPRPRQRCNAGAAPAAPALRRRRRRRGAVQRWSGGGTAGVGGSTSPSGSASAADWARAIVANRAALTVNLSTLTACRQAWRL
jgi:hypothetical protein